MNQKFYFLISYTVFALLTFCIGTVLISPVLVHGSEYSDACLTLTKNSKFGSRDLTMEGEVTKLQNFLIDFEYLDGKTTGYFGSKTREALKEFQKEESIPQTGVTDEVTRAAIATLSCGEPSDHSDDTNTPEISDPLPPAITQTSANDCVSGTVTWLDDTAITVMRNGAPTLLSCNGDLGTGSVGSVSNITARNGGQSSGNYLMNGYGSASFTCVHENGASRWKAIPGRKSCSVSPVTTNAPVTNPAQPTPTSYTCNGITSQTPCMSARSIENGTKIFVEWSTGITTNICHLYRFSSLGPTDQSYYDAHKVLLVQNVSGNNTYTGPYVGTAGNWPAPGRQQLKLVCGTTNLTATVIPVTPPTTPQTVATCSAPLGNLVFGDGEENGKKAEVINLQQFLAGKGFLKVAATGYFGSLTRQAVKDFQLSVGLGQTGMVNQATITKINAICTNVATPPPATTTRPVTNPTTHSSVPKISRFESSNSMAVPVGGTVTLNWNVQNANGCQILEYGNSDTAVIKSVTYASGVTEHDVKITNDHARSNDTAKFRLICSNTDGDSAPSYITQAISGVQQAINEKPTVSFSGSKTETTIDGVAYKALKWSASGEGKGMTECTLTASGVSSYKNKFKLTTSDKPGYKEAFKREYIVVGGPASRPSDWTVPYFGAEYVSWTEDTYNTFKGKIFKFSCKNDAGTTSKTDTF